MPRGRLLTLISLASFVLSFGGGALLVQIIINGFSHSFSNPLLFVSQLLLSLTMLIFGFFIGRKVGKELQDAKYSSRDFGAYEAFQQIRAGVIPSDWSVFRAGRTEILGKSGIVSGIALVCSFFLGIFIWSDPNTPVYEAWILSLYPCTIFLLGVVGPVWTWKRVKNQVLVITPEGFLLGNCQKPQAALRVKYRDIREIKVVGETVKLLGKDNWGVRNVAFYTFVPRPKEAAATLLAAFMRYKVNSLDEITITVPSMPSIEKHERNKE